MAIVAVGAAVDMSRVFAGRGDAVMARAACAQNLRVVHRVRGHPGIWVVAVLADIACLNMCRILAGRFRPIVATGAIAGDADMIEVRRQPASGRVAIVAGIAARNVSRVFACCCVAVMTGSARAEYLCMVDRRRRHKRECAVAVFTDVAGRYVCQIFSDGGCSIVATNAIIENVCMIKGGRNPPGGYMAVVALITGRDVTERLSGSL